MNNRVFISGRITGDSSYHSKFEDACTTVAREQFFDRHGTPALSDRYGHFGFVPVDPCGLTIFGNPLSAYPWWLCMVRTLAALTKCSYVYMLRDWKESRGARIEHSAAILLHKKIIYQ